MPFCVVAFGITIKPSVVLPVSVVLIVCNKSLSGGAHCADASRATKRVTTRAIPACKDF